MLQAHLTEYRRIRREYPDMPARRVVELARYRRLPALDLEWRGDSRGEYATWRHGVISDDGMSTVATVDVRATWRYDDDPAYEGPMPTDDPSSGIRNPDSTVSRYTDDYGRVQLTAPKYLALESGSTVPELAAFYRRAGMARGPAWEHAQREAQKYARQDAETTYYTCTVTVSVNGVELGGASLGSIGESGDDYAEAVAYRAETVSELLEDALEMARDHLANLQGVTL